MKIAPAAAAAATVWNDRSQTQRNASFRDSRSVLWVMGQGNRFVVATGSGGWIIYS